MSAILDAAQRQEEERKKKFKAEQDAFYAEVARRQVATGTGIGGKDNLEYTSGREGHRIAVAAEKQGLSVGDVRKETTKEAELKNQARNELLSESSKGSVTVGQRNPDGSRVTKASGKRPDEPTQDQINSQVGVIIQRDGGVNKHVADKYLGTNGKTQILGSTITGGEKSRANGNPYAPGTVEYYKQQFADSQKRKDEYENKTGEFKTVSPALVQDYNPFDFVDNEGKSTTKDKAVDVRIKPGFKGELVKTPSEDGGIEYYYHATPHEQKLYYDTERSYDLTGLQISNLKAEAFTNLLGRGESPTKEAVDKEVTNLLTDKYRVSGDLIGEEGYSVPSGKQDNEAIDKNYAIFKADQIVGAYNSGIEKNGVPSESAFGLNDYDRSLLIGGIKEAKAGGQLSEAEANKQIADIGIITGLGGKAISIRNDYNEAEAANKKAKADYQRQIFNEISEAKTLGYKAKVTTNKNKDTGEISSTIEYIPLPGQTQYKRFDYDTQGYDGKRYKAGEPVPLYFTDKNGKTREIQPTIEQEYAKTKELNPIARIGVGIGSLGREGVESVAGIFGIKDVFKSTDEAILGKDVKIKPQGTAESAATENLVDREAGLQLVGLGKDGKGGSHARLVPKFTPDKAAETLGKAAQADPFRLAGEAGFEATAFAAGGEAINLAGKGIGYVAPKVIKFAKGAKVPKTYGEEAKAEGKGVKVKAKAGEVKATDLVGEVPKGESPVKSTRDLFSTQAVSDLKETLSFKNLSTKLKTVGKRPTSEGVETELGGETSVATEGTSTVDDTLRISEEPTTTSEPSITNEPTSNPFDLGTGGNGGGIVDVAKPVEGFTPPEEILVGKGNKFKPPEELEKLRGNGRLTGKEKAKLAQDIKNARNKKLKHDELAATIKGLKNFGKGYRGGARSVALQYRQEVLEGLQALDQKVNPLKKIGAKGISGKDVGGKSNTLNNGEPYGERYPEIKREGVAKKKYDIFSADTVVTEGEVPTVRPKPQYRRDPEIVDLIEDVSSNTKEFDRLAEEFTRKMGYAKAENNIGVKPEAPKGELPTGKPTTGNAGSKGLDTVLVEKPQVNPKIKKIKEDLKSAKEDLAAIKENNAEFDRLYDNFMRTGETGLAGSYTKIEDKKKKKTDESYSSGASYYSTESFGYANNNRKRGSRTEGIEIGSYATPPDYKTPTSEKVGGKQGGKIVFDNLLGTGVKEKPTRPNKPEGGVGLNPTIFEPPKNTGKEKLGTGVPHVGGKVGGKIDLGLTSKEAITTDTTFKQTQGESFKFDFGQKETGRGRTTDSKLIPKEQKIQLKAPPIPFFGGGGAGLFSSGNKGKGKSSTKKHTVEDIYGGGAFEIQGEEALAGYEDNMSPFSLDIFGIGGKGKKKKRSKGLLSF